jgi:hypothetical protein
MIETMGDVIKKNRATDAYDARVAAEFPTPQSVCTAKMAERALQAAGWVK